MSDIREFRAELYDAPRTKEWPRHVRIIDGIAWRLAFAGYIAALIWAGVASRQDGAPAVPNQMSAPQSDLLVFAILGLAALLIVSAVAAVARKVRG